MPLRHQGSSASTMDLEEAKRFAEEANKRLREALAAQKLQEEASEIDKFAAVLQSFTQELLGVKHKLSVTADENNQGLGHVEKIIQIHTKVELISATLLQSKMEAKAKETPELVEKLNLEVSSLKKELDESKQAASKMSGLLESLDSELEVVKKEKVQAVNNEKAAVSRLQNLLEKKNKLKHQLKVSREREEKCEKMMERLTLMMSDLSAEAKEAKEKLLSANELVEKLRLEVNSLKQKLDNSKSSEAQLLEAEKLIETLKVEVEVAKKAQSDTKQEASKMVEERQKLKREIEDLKAKNEKYEISERKWQEKAKKLNPKVFFDISMGGSPAGRITMELFADRTPYAAENFRALCTGEKGIGRTGAHLHYKGLKFPQIVSGGWFIGGDIHGNKDSIGESIYGIVNQNYFLEDKGLGAIYMSVIGGKCGSRFWINMKENWSDNTNYCAIGRVVEGMHVVRMMNNSGVAGQVGGAREVTIVDCGQLL